ncbi:MAG: ATPase, T2SS/T4P/T4SS family [Acidobacteria bacterium]|nr:ATPase, T2SS/T4P/T4SS family [Acidobacteriota bacterium]
MIGQLLVATRAISQEQLDKALQEQRRTGALLGDVLVSMKYLTQEGLAKALAQEARVPFASLDGVGPDPRATGLVPESLARRGMFVAVSRSATRLKVAQANPFDVVAVDELQRTIEMPVEVVCAPKDAITRLLERSYGAGTGNRLQPLVDEGLAGLNQPYQDVAIEDSPVVRLIEVMIEDAVRAGATDLHLEPEEKVIRVRHRLDGILAHVETLPKELQPPIVSRLKVMAGLDISEQRLPQEGRITQVVAGRPVDFRVSTFPTVFGEKVAIRILEKDKLIRGLEDLGLNRRNLALFQDLLARSRGIVLVTGPTGAGQTTTLYSALNVLGGREKNIMTVEDPVEYEFPTIRQTQVRPRAGLTFATAIRSLLRQDPDVIMIGEIRDPETAQLAVRAALSGVLVFTTLHTQDSPGAVPRLMDMGVEPYLLASAMAGVVAQRLVRLVCTHCKAAVTYPPEILAKVNLTPADGVTFYKGQGCEHCGQTGYHGRVGVFEILMVDAGIHELIRDRADSRRIKDGAVRSGFKSLLDDALSKAVLGHTTLDEVLRVSYE